MATLLDDLLHLSLVTRATLKFEDVDVSAEVTAICDQLRARRVRHRTCQRRTDLLLRAR
jgi:light-regulated signal transduction histidine kinase (bacteriophytochrome)